MIQIFFDVSSKDLVKGLSKYEKKKMKDCIHECARLVSCAMRLGDLMFEDDPATVEKIAINFGEEEGGNARTIGRVVFQLMEFSRKLESPVEKLTVVDVRGDPRFEVGILTYELMHRLLKESFDGYIIVIQDDRIVSDCIYRDKMYLLVLGRLLATILQTKNVDDAEQRLNGNNDQVLFLIGQKFPEEAIKQTGSWVNLIYSCGR